MKKKLDKETILLLCSELEKDLSLLERLVQENIQAINRIDQGASDSLDFAALGYTIHNLYCLMENSFLRIAKNFENKIEQKSWHRDLVRRMTLEIKGLRPALFTEEEATRIDELRAFRHAFRSLYQAGIKAEKVLYVQKIVPEAIRSYREAVRKYIQNLYMIVEDKR